MENVLSYSKNDITITFVKDYQHNAYRIECDEKTKILRTSSNLSPTKNIYSMDSVILANPPMKSFVLKKNDILKVGVLFSNNPLPITIKIESIFSLSNSEVVYVACSEEVNVK